MQKRKIRNKYTPEQAMIDAQIKLGRGSWLEKHKLLKTAQNIYLKKTDTFHEEETFRRMGSPFFNRKRIDQTDKTKRWRLIGAKDFSGGICKCNPLFEQIEWGANRFLPAIICWSCNAVHEVL